MAWQPSLGAWRQEQGTRFRVWAPEAKRIEVALETSPDRTVTFSLEKSSDGFFQGTVAEVTDGDLYRYLVNGHGPYPDPASRYQPKGVHGPSQVIDPAEYQWADRKWTGIRLADLVLYELHVGTFTPAGTFAAAAGRLPALRDLGVTAVELMPVADFAGGRNWGYDGVAPSAPARCYGAPDDLRRFVDAAHAFGLAVQLDVVYNHIGPEGAYLGIFSPYYFSTRHNNAWGAGINLDGPYSGPVRAFFIESALHWIHEYHIDGLRLDATHAIVDRSPRHFLAEISAAVRDSLKDSCRRALVIAEDARNLAHIVKPEPEKGWGLDAVWSDDFHHQMRRFLAGDHDGYFQDFDGMMPDIAATVRRGWFYCGQYSRFFSQPRGTDPAGLIPSRFVLFLQNHDQVGNRAFGERLHHQIDLAAYRAAIALLLLLPQTPLIFMGQEWAASTPFQYFTDHHPELGKQVTKGRRTEFRSFAAFADAKIREQIPDPQDPKTFQASRLLWEERDRQPHTSMLRLCKRLLTIRRTEPVMRAQDAAQFEVMDLNKDTLLLLRSAPSSPALLAVIRLRGSGLENLCGNPLADAGERFKWTLMLTTEDAAFAPDGLPPHVEKAGPVIEFPRPAAVILKAKPRSR